LGFGTKSGTKSGAKPKPSASSSTKPDVKSSVKSSAKRSFEGVTSNAILAPRIVFISIVGCLLLFGLVMLFSASSVFSYYANDNTAAMFTKQVVFVVVGCVLALAVAIFPFERIIDRISYPGWFITVAFLVGTLAIGSLMLGSKREFELGFMSFQPSELAKIAMILVLTHLVERIHKTGTSRQLVAVMVVAALVPIGLIAAEPDLGTTIIAVIGILSVLWFGGIPKRVLAIIVAATLALGLIMMFAVDFRQGRWGAFLDPWADPLGNGYQILNSYYAFGDGGLFGVGIGLSRQKFTYLPEAHNDFIFAIVGEELGLVGALVVVALFMGLVLSAFQIARHAPSRTGSILAASSAVLIGSQAFLNMLCVVGAMPVTGKPLPFFSAGGSSMISTMILVGLILSVSFESKEPSVHDLRREQLVILNGGGGRQQGALDIPASSSSAIEVVASRKASKAPIPANGSNAVRSARVIPISMSALRKNRSGLADRYRMLQDNAPTAAAVGMSEKQSSEQNSRTATLYRKVRVP
jgi:cell division protein FtsW